MATLMAIQKHVTDDARIRELSAEVRMCFWRWQRFQCRWLLGLGQRTISDTVWHHSRHLQVERLKTKLGELHNSDVHQLKYATMSCASCNCTVDSGLLYMYTCI